tara:strand:- start:9 stop:278 length:270 start_codon:yes stop_codon:yes gene_type:complete
MAKKEKVVDLKPTSITEDELKKVQEIVGRINKAQMDIGQLESRKHQALHYIAGINDELTLLQEELKKEYGTIDVNINDGTINYDVKADS